MTGAGQVAIYVTHPEVAIDPAVPVPDWGLSPVGAARVAALAARLSFPPGTRVISSAERKALDTAEPLAARAGCIVETRPDMHENDRSATGFLPGPEFEATADAFFARPDQSVRGWERAVDAQQRIVAQVAAALADPAPGGVIFTGHGGVGTLLYCAFSGQAIDRKWDQPGPGHWFAFDIATRRPICHWRPIEALSVL